MKHMLVRVGWKPDFVEKSVPILPISGWMGDNLIKKTENMGWWKGERCCGAGGKVAGQRGDWAAGQQLQAGVQAGVQVGAAGQQLQAGRQARCMLPHAVLPSCKLPGTLTHPPPTALRPAGVDAVAADNTTHHIDTLLDALNNYVQVRPWC